MLDIQKVKSLAINNYEKIFQGLEISLDEAIIDVNEIRIPCPIHGGDNKTAFCYYVETGVWVCYTSDCNEKHGHDLLALVMSIKKLNFKQAMEWILNTCDQTNESFASRDTSDITSLKKEVFIAKDVELFKTNMKPMSISDFKSFAIPDNEFFSEKFSKKTIDKFMISICRTKGKPMFNRAFAPILDIDGSNVIGFTARTLYPMCDKCGCYHKKMSLCPHEGNYLPSPKWMHSGCSTSTLLYNYAYALKEIKRTSIMIMVEGPKEVWWLDQCGISNSTAILGSAITDSHLQLAIDSGATTIITCFDKDGAGQKAFDKLRGKFSSYFNIINLGELLENNVDLDEMPEESVRQMFVPVLKKY